MFTQKIDNDLMITLVDPSFAEKYLAIVENEREYLAKFLAWPSHATDINFFQNFVLHMLTEYAQGKSITCAIFYKEDLVGNISLNNINHSLNKAHIGYWISKDVQGLGIATRCVQFLCHFAFDKLSLEKVELAAATNNNASRAVAERCGFAQEGIIRRAENINGQVIDHAVYGLLKGNHLNNTEN